jgi:hypothetical protein
VIGAEQLKTPQFLRDEMSGANCISIMLGIQVQKGGTGQALRKSEKENFGYVLNARLTFCGYLWRGRMTFLEWVTEQYPKQFIPEKQLMLLRAAWNAGRAAERESGDEPEGGRSDERRLLDELASYLKIAEREAEKLEAHQEALIAAAEAVIARWETPLWKDAEPTAEVIYRLRDAVERIKGETIIDMESFQPRSTIALYNGPPLNTREQFVEKPVEEE